MRKPKLLVNFFVITLFSLTFISAHTGNDEFDHCSGFCPMLSGNYGYGGILFGWLTGILILVALILLIVWLIKQIQKKK